MKALVIVVAVAAATAGFAQTTASAARPVAVTIEIVPTVFGPVQVGTWEVSGAISDSGTYERTGGHGTGSLPECFCNFEHTAAFMETFLLTGSKGTITVKAQERIVPNGEEFPPSVGVWQVVSGTGAYERIGGHGTSVFDFPTLYLTGVISRAE
jgi:hypothetical protein